jgi:uncharacterized protein (TIGR02996 family)
MTSDGEALFRAICEHPAEDTPRLVYADWLDENGRPERAEFIRLQCEAWAPGAAYPTVAAARTRASALQRAFGDRWYNELPELPGVEWGDLFVRGFIDTVRTYRLHDVTVTLVQVFAAAPVRHFIVTEMHPGQFRELLEFPLLARLKTLSLPGTIGREEELIEAARERFPTVRIS